MTNILKQSLFAALLLLTPYWGKSAASKHPTGHQTQQAQVSEAKDLQGSKLKWSSTKKDKSSKKKRLKERIHKWVNDAAISLPKGKLLTSLLLLILSIVFLAVAGATKYGLIFGILGSIAVIGAVIALLLWLSERSKSAAPTPN